MKEMTIERIQMHDDKTDLFEGQYPIPDGISYNSALLMGDEIVVMDTADARVCDDWMASIVRKLDGRSPKALVISHMEPDHSGSIKALVKLYPDIELVGNAKTFAMLDQFFGGEAPAQKRVVVKDGDSYFFGESEMKFIFAPMVHWPEVMLCYLPVEKVLFSADAFGRFGPAEKSYPWTDEGRRYYTNIVGKYGTQVKAVLKKAAGLDIERICPLHGPDLEGEEIASALSLYEKWSDYEPEDSGTLVAYAGFHGNTRAAAELMEKTLIALGNEVTLIDLARTHKSYAVAEAFKHKHLILASTTYDAAYMPAMEQYLLTLKAKNLQNRTVGLIENGTWAPMAAKHMRGVLETMKGMEILEDVITIRSSMNEKNREEIARLAEKIAR